MKDLTILLPTRNERQGLKSTLCNLVLLKERPEILVVDTNSTDGTLEVARDFGIKVIREPRKGKGVALITGFNNIETKYVIMMDADGTYPVYSIPQIYKELQDGWEVILGYRKNKVKGSMSQFHSFGNSCLSLMASILYLHKVKDVCTGMKGFETDIVNSLCLKCRGFEIEAEIFSQAVGMGCKIKEIGIDYLPRQGKAKLNGIKDGLKIGLELIKGRF